MDRQKDNTFNIKISKFFQGMSPTHFKNTLSTFGNFNGHANAMTNCDILTPDYLTQGPGVSNLTGNPSMLIKFIMDRVVASGVSYALSNTKLHTLTSTTISAGHTINGATRGESLAYLKGYLYYFYQDDFGRFDLSSSYDDDYGSTIPTGAASLQNAPHPTAVKEDIMCIGNGQYLATFISSTTTLAATKLDFGTNMEVVDVLFTNNKWLIAVNTANADDDNRGLGYLYWYDGSAVSSLLEDEASIGIQKIGFIKVVNGVIYIAFQDLSSTGGYKIGYLSGNRIITLGHFTGSLPNFRQKTLYKNVLLFISDTKVWAAGASVVELPFALSQLAQGVYTTNAGGIGAPFGTPLIATDNGSSYSIAKFSGYTVTSNWTSLIQQLSQGKNLARINEMIVYTEALGSGARCDITVKCNDESSNSSAQEVSTEGQRRHIFKINKSDIENVRIYIDFANSSISNPAKIKYIELTGNIIGR